MARTISTRKHVSVAPQAFPSVICIRQYEGGDTCIWGGVPAPISSGISSMLFRSMSLVIDLDTLKEAITNGEMITDLGWDIEKWILRGYQLLTNGDSEDGGRQRDGTRQPVRGGVMSAAVLCAQTCWPPTPMPIHHPRLPSPSRLSQ